MGIRRVICNVQIERKVIRKEKERKNCGDYAIK